MAKVLTGETPFSLVYGTKVILPSEAIMLTARYGLLTPDTNRHELAHDMDTIDELKLTKIRMVSYQQRISNTYNKHVHVRTFQVGDLVLKKTFQNTMDTTVGKFAEIWEGPYFIDDIVGRGAY